MIRLAEQAAELSYTRLEIDMRAANWLEANMCAPLGAILYKTSRNLNTIRFTNVPSRVARILAKNGFLSNYGFTRLRDTWSTTIQYTRFEQKDDRYFGAYIERHFKSKAIPKMSDPLRKKFWESIFEIFSNAVIHSETKLGIFACGQFFPKMNRLDFSIADLGIGIQKNLIKKRALRLSPEQAINWAMEGRNTTKTGSIPGGLGLKLLREFIRLNQGHIQIVSNQGYWEQMSDGKVVMKTFPFPFPGTVVNIEINTADINTYRLSSETSPEDIF
ncbi:MAG TPA: ATP-binding protein [Anaerolineales bacterium]|nr:ATP-binding protein [Anaerolineales bacterium]